MEINEYQILASRTINRKLDLMQQEHHALHGIVGEVGEIHSIYQKEFQGHDVCEEHLKKELGDLMWFIAEYCTVMNWNLDEICKINIEKLKARYPNGFAVEKSLHRKESDV